MRRLSSATLAKIAVAISVAGSAVAVTGGFATGQGPLPDPPDVSTTPVGAVTPFAGNDTPPGWLAANGQAISRAAFPELFAVIGTTYGAGDGSTTFNVPDLRQRFPLGRASSGTGATLGSTGGAIDHTHSGPSHTHTTPAHSHTVNGHTHQFISPVGQSASFGRIFDPGDPILDSVGSHTSAGITTINHVEAGGYNSGSLSQYHMVTTSSSSPGTSNASPTTNSSGTGATGSSNPPFIALNYIIHAKPAP